MAHRPLTSDDLWQGLACAVLQPGLRSVLVFDVTFTELEELAELVTAMLDNVTGEKPSRITLGSTDKEDRLWGQWTFCKRSDAGELGLIWQPGVLLTASGEQPAQYSSPPHLVIIPDLSNLSLVAARACVVCNDAEVVHLERHGQSRGYRPNIFWLAACPSPHVDSVSPHLLDRFALRLRRPIVSTSAEKRSAELRACLAPSQGLAIPPLPRDLVEKLQNARHRGWPEVTSKAIEHIFDYFPAVPESGHQCQGVRRELALARLAVAVARLAGTPSVEANHVDDAARIVNLAPTAMAPSEIPSEKEITRQQEPTGIKIPVSEKSAPAGTGAILSNEDQIPALTDPSTKSPEIVGPDINHPSPPDEKISGHNISLKIPITVNPQDTPNREDRAPVQRNVNTLRIPLQQHRRSSNVKGSVIGVQSTNTLNDVALIPTFLEAAKFQCIRWHWRGEGGFTEQQPQDQKSSNRRLLLSASDLRRYRVAHTPEPMLVIVIDYTSVKGRDWLDALYRHRKWAYVERASLSIIQVGIDDPHQELQAKRILARNVLVPSVAAALDLGIHPGRATPLAHGLELAFRTLCQALQHGRSPIYQARLVVITDGRGNVPLAASRANTIPTQPVSREGIEDALTWARQICTLKAVQVFLLDPQPPQHRELPQELASALGTTATAIQKIWVKK